MKDRKVPFFNLRLLPIFASALLFGIFLFGRLFFGGWKWSDFLFPALFLPFLLFPLSKKRILSSLSLFLIGALFGALLLGIHERRYFKTEAFETLQGTVVSIDRGRGYSSIVLSNLKAGNRKIFGKCLLKTEEELFLGEIISFETKLSPVSSSDLDFEYHFSNNIRFTGDLEAFEFVGRSKNPLLTLREKLFSLLEREMGETSGIAYALLTGDSSAIDSSLLTLARQGGIAHIFAVSGLHIGILFAAVCLLLRPFGRKRYFPAALSALCYSAFCGFTISSLRAAIMCLELSFHRYFGKKYDLLSSLSIAAVLCLILFPYDFYSAGFRLSFGAVLSLCLFSGPLNRTLKGWKVPKFLSDYLSAGLSVQLFLIPIELEAFGYASLMGILLNFFVLPIMPPLFAGLLLAAVFSLIFPALSFLLLPPKAFLTLIEAFFALFENIPSLSGFALGAGAVVSLCGALFFSGLIRFGPKQKLFAAGVLSAALSVILVFSNLPLSYCTLDVYSEEGGALALVSTKEARVLLLGDVSLDKAKDFLNRTYGGKLDAVFVLSDDEVPAIGKAAALGPEKIYAFESVETGLFFPLDVGDSKIGSLLFTYESATKLILSAEGVCAEFEFGDGANLFSELSLPQAGGKRRYLLKGGSFRSL